MAQQPFQSCVDACNACADACDFCAISSLQEPDTKVMARCIALAIDCAQMCRLAAGFIARGSEVSTVICQACIQLCEDCREECAQYKMPHCKACEKACHDCINACRNMIVAMSTTHRDSRAGMATH